MLHILPGAEKRKTKEQEADGEEKRDEKSSFKKEKAAKVKASIGKTHSWNTLFLGPNAVAETLAEKLGVEKSDLLLGESGERYTFLILSQFIYNFLVLEYVWH